ncbi:MAG TPA: ABC transporter permease [bacterium]|nr:ABC transporter permease [bacterium]
MINVLKRHPLMLWGGLIVAALVVTALTAPILAPQDPKAQDLAQSLLSPGWHHWLGTDQYGRDVLSRLLYGARVSLAVGFVAVSLYVLIGVTLGALAGYYGGWVDLVLMRFVDVMLCIPTLFLILMVIAFVGPSILNVMVVIGLTSWMGVARLVRGEFLTLKERDFVTAARVIGMTDARIILTQILPNALGPVLVVATLGVGSTILTESALSFLGLGVQPPTASWGNMLTEGKEHLTDAWWLVTFPGLAIFTTVLGYNLLGQGLRDWLDPRHQGKH